MYQVVLQANLIGIKHLKAQVIGNQLDNLVRQHIIKNYHGYDYPHGTGHGLGRVVHENPRVNKIYDKPLLENSLVTIEPGIYIPGFGGIRIEDTILITKTGCEVLTSKSKK
jgi:Xaa-Pro aminopeptidase